MWWEEVKTMVIETLRRLPPSARIPVHDRIFTPEELIREIEAETSYGRIYVIMWAKQHGITIEG